MTRWRWQGATLSLTLVAATAGCADDGPPGDTLAASLCPTVQAWSDATVDAVDAFRVDSRELDPAERRERYERAFEELAALRERVADELAALELPDAVAAGMDDVLVAVSRVIEDGAVEAEGLPDAAYQRIAVSEGSLVTGVEKAKAITFNSLADLAEDPTSGVPRGCGRRGALDLSPSATFPP